MSSNTLKRIYSALLILVFLSFIFYLGKEAILCLILLAMMLILDEIFRNFLKRKPWEFSYIFAQLSLLIPFIYIFFLKWAPINMVEFLIHWGLLNNIFLLIYLFFVPMSDLTLVIRAKRYPYLVGIFFLPMIVSLGSVIRFEMGERYALALLIINSSMDTGGWFFGKLLGKNKLWPEVSPKKTIEGLVGGILTAMILGSLYWHFFIFPINYAFCITFAIFALFSQMGDLVQSKQKRQFGIKDSSQMIPGHGGLYDRVDSLIFLAPFFAVTLRYIKGYYLG